MKRAAILLDKGGTTPPLKRRSSMSLVWEALLGRLEDEGRLEEFRSMSRCGLGIRGAFGAQYGWPNSPCGRWFCPPCNRRRSTRRKLAVAPRVAAAMGSQGGCGSLTLSLALNGSPNDGLACLRASMGKVRGMAAWGNCPNGWKLKVGMLAAFEVSAKVDGSIHPHLHLAVFGPKRHEVRAFMDWLKAIWLSMHPDADPEAQKLGDVRGPGEPWEEWVSYVLKGTQINPEWPREVLCSVLDLFPRGTRHGATWGRYRLGKNAVGSQGQAQGRGRGQNQGNSSAGPLGTKLGRAKQGESKE